MSALILNQHEIEELLPMDACMDVVADALRTLAKGQAKNPLRTGMPLPGGGVLGLMPGSMESPASLGLKIVAVFPSNHGTTQPEKTVACAQRSRDPLQVSVIPELRIILANFCRLV